MNAVLAVYKSYAARVEFDAEGHIFVGQLAGITDIVTFHGSSVEKLEAEFRAAVDHYLAVSEKTGIPPQQPCSGKLVSVCSAGGSRPRRDESRGARKKSE